MDSFKSKHISGSLQKIVYNFIAFDRNRLKFWEKNLLKSVKSKAACHINKGAIMPINSAAMQKI